ncbi:MAG: thioredoxin [Eubacteriales bacterium]|nr:thioredoxin [Eubacteriales bacterium]
MVNKIVNNDMSALEKESYAVVDFSAEWCGPCKMLAPIFHELSEEMTDVAFYNIDSDENMELAQKYGIQSIPSLLIMKNGEVVANSLGFQPKPVLKAFIESNK